MPVLFFNEDHEYQINDPDKVSEWIIEVIRSEKLDPGNINYIFCSDEYLRDINIKYLSHDYFTDIITFDNSDSKELIEGDIYISVPRVLENSSLHKTEFEKELSRVLVHGVLHLCGYDDKTDSDKAVMRKKEEAYLSLQD